MTDQGTQKNTATTPPSEEGTSVDNTYKPRRTESNDRRRFVLSVIIVGTWSVAGLAWVLISFAGPVYSADGASIVNDRPGTIESALGVIGTVASAVIGFWFGAAGKSSAEKAAAEAGDRANQSEIRASEESTKAKAADERAAKSAGAALALEPLVDSTKKETLAEIKRLYPDAFNQRVGA